MKRGKEGESEREKDRDSRDLNWLYHRCTALLQRVP